MQLGRKLDHPGDAGARLLGEYIWIGADEGRAYVVHAHNVHEQSSRRGGGSHVGSYVLRPEYTYSEPLGWVRPLDGVQLSAKAVREVRALELAPRTATSSLKRSMVSKASAAATARHAEAHLRKQFF